MEPYRACPMPCATQRPKAKAILTFKYTHQELAPSKPPLYLVRLGDPGEVGGVCRADHGTWDLGVGFVPIRGAVTRNYVKLLHFRSNRRNDRK